MKETKTSISRFSLFDWIAHDGESCQIAMAATTYRYLTEDGAKRILQYKYSGSDASLLYNYVISPLAQKLVDHAIPQSLAPNAITISGLAVVILTHLIMLWFSPNMEEEAPRWVYASAGIALLVYQILDVADGKQARKTGNSSPLGLLFDHGCDALNVVISACTFASTIMLGPTYWVRILPLDVVCLLRAHLLLINVSVPAHTHGTKHGVFHGHMGRILHWDACPTSRKWTKRGSRNYVLDLHVHGNHRTCLLEAVEHFVSILAK